jgi:DNA polymerase III subunit epsilon
MEIYTWWGGVKPPPDNLKTKRQLSELGLAPLQPVAKIPTSKYDLFLYEPSDPESVRPKKKLSDRQNAALERARLKSRFNAELAYWKREFKSLEEDWIRQVKWAKKVFSNADHWCILDIETTGIDDDAQVVEIAIVDLSGKPLLNTLVRPAEVEISPDARTLHGITADEVNNAPTFAEVYLDLEGQLKEKQIIAYNSDFDFRVINHCCIFFELPLLDLDCSGECLMRRYTAWCGEWSNYYKNYRWQRLDGGHRALSDCQKALEYLRKMAEDTTDFCYTNDLINLANQLEIQLN